MTLSITHILQLVVGLGLLNVWLVRRQSATAYRGGTSRTLQQEFSAYGLPAPVFFIVGALKITGQWCSSPGCGWPCPCVRQRWWCWR